MKKYLLLLFLINVTYLFSQNGIIGDGFGVPDWSTTDCFASSAGNSRIFITNSNGTGNKYFRLVTCWDNDYSNWGPQNSADKLLSYGTAYNSSDMIKDSGKAYYLDANSSYNYVFKTREPGLQPANLGMVVFEVQGEIRTVSSVSNNTTHSPGDPYTVTATLSGSLSSGQGVYLRYSDDSWNTSSVVEMTGSTTSYSASIPADVNVAQASISYYIFTSGSGLTFSAGDSDFFTINSNTNSGNNFSYDVVDTTAPVITLTGDATVTLEVGATYTEQGATATDNYDTAVTVVIGGDTVDTSTVGTYTVTYDATDANNNAATQVTRTVNVVDTTAPVITLTGDATVTLEVGATYTEQGATATDNYDTAVTVVIGGDTVDTSTVGTYTVTYDATDANNNAATQVTRTVNVVDTTAPVITLTGDATVTLEVGATYTEQGATATDNYDTAVTVVIGGDTVDTSTVGTYTVTYDATDANNNAATQVTRTVNVVDTTAPVITLTGDATVTLEVGATYTEQGATATDNYDTAVTVVIGGDTVDTSTVGTYTVTYDATDANNNAATQVTRTVNVVDTTAPVITLTGDATVTLEVGATYTEQGATATDNYDTAVTVVIGGDTVDTSTVGTYTVTYDATDANNNAATQVTRTVNVVDTTAPVITLTGDATVTLEVGATYTEQGATATDNYDTAVTVVIGGDTVDTSTVGTYTVTYDVTDANNNAATQVTRTVNVVDSLSVDEVNKVKLSIFPNPTSNYWIIKAKNEIKSISLYDISGRKILQKRPSVKNVEINAQSLPSGVYLLKVNKTNTFRVLKL